MKDKLISLLVEHFKESSDKFEISTAVIPFKSEEFQLSVKVTVSQKAGFLEEPDYEFDLRVFQFEGLDENFSSTLMGFTNNPVLVPLQRIIDNLKNIPYDWIIHWANSLRTFASLAQFMNFCMLPFIEIEEDPNAVTITPCLYPAPGSVVPEVIETYLDKDCYIASFHVSETNLRVVIAQEDKAGTGDFDFKPILIDLDCEKTTFEDLLELKNEFDSSNFESYLRFIKAIDKEKKTNFEGKEMEFRNWVGKIMNQDPDFKDLYVDSKLPQSKQVFEVKTEDERPSKEFEQHLRLLKEAVSKVKTSLFSPPYFCSMYLEEYDDYVLLCFNESTNLQSAECFYIEWLIYQLPTDSDEIGVDPDYKDNPGDRGLGQNASQSPGPKRGDDQKEPKKQKVRRAMEWKESQRIEVSKARLNLDFGINFTLLNPDEKNFFYQAYSKLVVVRRFERGDSEATYTAFLKEFTVEMTKNSTVGTTFKMPLKFKLISNQQQPIAVTVSTFNEHIVQMVGAVLAINPRKLS